MDSTSANSAQLAITRRGVELRLRYPQILDLNEDVLFLAFLLESSRFGVFSFGPLSINCEFVEERFVQSLPEGVPRGAKYGMDQSFHDFHARLGVEIERSGTRRPNELHYLLAFMRSPAGLARDVFGELGIRPETIEAFARDQHGARQATPLSAEVFLSPEDVARRLTVNEQTVRAWIRSGNLPASRLAGRKVLRIRESDLEKILEPVDPNDFK